MDPNQLQAAMAGQPKRGAGDGPSAADQALRGDPRNNILSQILDQSARARLNAIGSVDAAKLQKIEAMLIGMAQKGQIRHKMKEDELKSVLDQIAEQTNQETKVSYTRRKVFGSDSEDDDDY